MLRRIVATAVEEFPGAGHGSGIVEAGQSVAMPGTSYATQVTQGYIVCNHTDGASNQRGADEIQHADERQAIGRRKALRAKCDLEQAAATVEWLDIRAPSLPGDKEAAHQARDAQSKEDQKERKPHGEVQ
jgi:hypothetical protein